MGSDDAGRPFEHPVRAVVVAAGAIGTPLLLLRSTGARHEAGLGNQNGLIGRYLHDHVSHLFVLHLGRSMPRLRHVAYISRGPYGIKEPLTSGQVTIGARHTKLERLLALVPSATHRFGFGVFSPSRPSSENIVTLASDGTAILQSRYSATDINGALDTEKGVIELLDAANLAPSVVWSKSDHTVGEAVHYAGTARMHQTPEFGAVDPWNRIWTAPNVIVADASSFTASSEKNPTLTSMAIAWRATARLAMELT